MAMTFTIHPYIGLQHGAFIYDCDCSGRGQFAGGNCIGVWFGDSGVSFGVCFFALGGDFGISQLAIDA